MRVGCVVITDGRVEPMARTVRSLLDNVHYEWDDLVMVNDSADADHQHLLKVAFPEFRHIAHEERLGFAGALNSAWAATDECDYLFHLEDDFKMKREIPIPDMIRVLQENPHIAQMALKRQPVNAAEVEAGGYLFDNEVEHKSSGDASWMEHRKFFTTNPSVIPKWVRDRRFQPPEAEGKFAIDLFAERPDVRCAYWGSGEEWVTHIGDERTAGWQE